MAVEQTLYTQFPPKEPQETVQDLVVKRVPDIGLPDSFVRFFEQLPTTRKVPHSATLLYRPDEVDKLRNATSPEEGLQCIINLKRINDIRYINKFFEAVNAKLAMGGLIVGRVETNGQRYHRIMDKYPAVIRNIVYFFDFLIKRVWPKLPHLRKLYFHLFKGRGRVLSEIETLGRLISCGYKIIEAESVDGKLYFLAEKIGEPDFNHQVTYDPLIRLNRTGKNGKPIRVLKFRTMYPYSEYLQEYIYEQQGLREGGKVSNDPRINSVGRFMRKYFLDEWPMFINLLRGELKLFGVRPLSKHYLGIYPADFREYRKGFKPGLIPPYYVDMPDTIEEIVASEKRYLEAYEKHPFLTDLRYLVKAIRNIIVKKARSC